MASWWNERREARLRVLWATDKTTKEIAHIMHITEGMVTGKARRMALPRKDRWRTTRIPKLPIPPKVRKPKVDKRPRTGITYAPNAHPLVNALIKEMNAQRCSWVALAKRSGVGLSTFTSWRTVNTPALASLEACFNVLGKTLQPVDMPDGNDD